MVLCRAPDGMGAGILASSGVDAATSTACFRPAQPSRCGKRHHPLPTEAETAHHRFDGPRNIIKNWRNPRKNPFFHDPICIPDGNIDAWLHGTDLPPNIVDLISKLAYQNGDSLFFSDVPAILKYATSDDEARHWIKILTECAQSSPTSNSMARKTSRPGKNTGAPTSTASINCP